jgi:hypothetical protein
MKFGVECFHASPLNNFEVVKSGYFKSGTLLAGDVNEVLLVFCKFFFPFV